MITTEKWQGRTALMVANCAGFVDLVALPVWISTLITGYQFDPQQAGGLVTMFLLGMVVASAIVASQFHKLNPRLVATLGFAVAAAAFIWTSTQSGYTQLAIAHVLGGLATGVAMSATHGTIGRSAGPHRLFALAGSALGVFAVFYLGALPNIVASFGREALFYAFTGVMLIGALFCAVWFPVPFKETTEAEEAAKLMKPQKLSGVVWAVMAGVVCLTISQSMNFSFIQEVGTKVYGSTVAAITTLFIVLGIFNMSPAPLAVFLEKKWSAENVAIAGPIYQAICSVLIMAGLGFGPYALGAVIMTFGVVFTHTFVFGMLARLDPSGRAVAASPACLMIGSAIGPILGGTLVKSFGFSAIAIATCVVALIAVILFSQARMRRSPAVATA